MIIDVTDIGQRKDRFTPIALTTRDRGDGARRATVVCAAFRMPCNLDPFYNRFPMNFGTSPIMIKLNQLLEAGLQIILSMS